jgi:hypothetical protein
MFPHFLDNRLKDGGEVVSLNNRLAALFPTGTFLVFVSVTDRVYPRDLQSPVGRISLV